MNTQNQRILRKSGYCVLPVYRLCGRYYINRNCDIVDIDKNEIIYRWDPLTARTGIEFTLDNGEVRIIAPINAFMTTFYGYLEAEIYDSGYGAPSKRYSYITKITEKVKSEYLVLNGEIFKYSKRFDLYANQYGCICNGTKITIHYVDPKGYHLSSDCRVHRIVYDAWVGINNPENDIHHRDMNTWNNYYKNLEELTSEEHQKLKNSNYVYDDEVIYEICKLLSLGLRPFEIAEKMNVPSQLIIHLRNGSRSEISSKFTYPELPLYKLTKLSEVQVREICKLFEDTSLTNKEIGEIYNVDAYTIQDIRKRITWRDVSKDYQFSSDNPTIRKFNQNPECRRNASITEDDVVKVYKLLLDGNRICDVRDMTGISYSIIKKIKYKTRWASITDKIDAQKNAMQ